MTAQNISHQLKVHGNSSYLVHWIEDAADAFSVIIFGIGPSSGTAGQVGYVSGDNPVISPSGKWKVHCSDVAGLAPDPAKIHIGHGSSHVQSAADDQVRFIFPAYGDDFAIANGCATDSEPFDKTTSGNHVTGWTAMQRMTVLANDANPLNWVFVINYNGRKA